MGAPAAHPRTTARALALAALSLAATAAVAGCGSSGQPQDAGEPRGNFPVAVLNATFPQGQHLAKRSRMEIDVRNEGSKEVPDISVTVKCPGSGLGGSFDQETAASDVADSRRPLFAVDTIPTNKATSRPPLDPAPLERSTAYVDTYTLGPLASGRTARFQWTVTAVKAGSYRLCWRVNAGLAGKAKAVTASGSGPIEGEFDGTISNTPPQATIAPNGQTVVRNPAG